MLSLPWKPLLAAAGECVEQRGGLSKDGVADRGRAEASLGCGTASMETVWQGGLS